MRVAIIAFYVVAIIVVAAIAFSDRLMPKRCEGNFLVDELHCVMKP